MDLLLVNPSSLISEVLHRKVTVIHDSTLCGKFTVRGRCTEEDLSTEMGWIESPSGCD